VLCAEQSSGKSAGERDVDAVCESWLAYRKENAAAMLAYGRWLELRRGDVSGAEECYRIAIEHGRQKTHWLTRAPFSDNCRQWFEAKDRVWIQARALNRLAVLLHSVHNKSEAAEAAWNEAHRVDPKYVEAYLAHAQMLAKSADRCQEAEGLLRTALAVNSSHVPVLFECAKLLHHAKTEPYEAERMYRRCLREAPHHVGALSQYAMLLGKTLKDDSAALGMCKRALALEPDNVDVLSLYARLVFDTQGDYAEAERVLVGVLERDLSCVDALYHYGRLLQEVTHPRSRADALSRACYA
jgi:tetratricopeptide (TPR) repeat protein